MNDPYRTPASPSPEDPKEARIRSDVDSLTEEFRFQLGRERGEDLSSTGLLGFTIRFFLEKFVRAIDRTNERIDALARRRDEDYFHSSKGGGPG